MKKTIIGMIACIAIFTTLFSPLMAESRSPRFKIGVGGYRFYASYKLHLASSHLVVNVATGRYTLTHACENAMIRPGGLHTTLRFTLDGNSAALEGRESRYGYQIIENVNISPSSVWYPWLKQLLKKVAIQCDSAWQTMQKGPLPYLEALPRCMLRTMYSIHFKSPLKRYTSRSTVLSVLTQLETIEKYGNQETLTAVVTFRVKKKRKGDFPQAKEVMIKFVKTKNGLQEIAAKNSKRSSEWYTPVKKVVRKNMRMYSKLKKTHEHMSIQDGI